jgi:hypothetical protein
MFVREVKRRMAFAPTGRRARAPANFNRFDTTGIEYGGDDL